MKQILLTILFAIVYTLLYEFLGAESAICTGIGQIIAILITIEDKIK